MKKMQFFNVAPKVPAEISFLETLARNMWWCWNPDSIELFRRINPQIWRESSHNPLDFLNRIPQKKLESLTRDDGYMSHLEKIKERFESTILPNIEHRLTSCIAYLSLEYGIHESVRLYSGGLGVLAGDHLKSASDLRVPLVAVGLSYRQGYFQQYLNNDGWQQENYPENELHLQPIVKACNKDNQQIQIHVPLPEGICKANIWQLDVGRISLYLLDTNIPDNPPDFQKITAQLYGGDRKARLRQELLLGIGGFRALLALGYDPIVCHMNEGHAVFSSMQRLSHLMQKLNLEKNVALEIVQRTTVFTTHTPVPAGNEAFELGLIRPHLEALRGELKLDPEEIISWGMPGGQPLNEMSLTILGLRMANLSNGVSKLHGKVARKMWRGLWPDTPEEEIPIGSITNGVHIPSWLSPDNAVLFDRYLGPEWREKPSDEEVLSLVSQIPDEELWRAHELGKSRLIRMARDVMEKSYTARNATRSEMNEIKGVLDHDGLTIGFARRFATYKRGTLLLRDPKRLEALLKNDQYHVQLIFAGKAHPADNNGKDFIRQIVHFAKRTNLQRKILFLENYDMYIARTLVQGVDVWLNTPRRPQEASGTSGMKAAANGTLNVSILDGWWDEANSKEAGWSIGHGEEYEDTEYQDTVESQALFNLLENDLIPMYFDRQASELPSRWIKMMKASIKMSLGYFTSHRMVSEYESQFYVPAISEYEHLIADDSAKAKRLVAHKQKLMNSWPKVKVNMPQSDKNLSIMHVGDTFNVTVTVELGDLTSEEVDIQVYYGTVNMENKIIDSFVENMSVMENRGNGSMTYKHTITCKSSGRYGFTARAVPAGKDFQNFMPKLITWASD